ncbi:hypothetical protein GGS23DRAFT_618298 [Durotheca rogersii]|uniref:uncharacterized protein n=1 Tax=Durotheca rogersii TaxID=419775 RepID=UPI00221F9443|nr:uncharacterized protein GGS23DRAFT_618298 [Durotheca rogersii]KAI5865281.1 hypothetical protein GGS23DRAFT_618298 [Durotheca rogersii]
MAPPSPHTPAAPGPARPPLDPGGALDPTVPPGLVRVGASVLPGLDGRVLAPCRPAAIRAAAATLRHGLRRRTRVLGQRRPRAAYRGPSARSWWRAASPAGLLRGAYAVWARAAPGARPWDLGRALLPALAGRAAALDALAACPLGAAPRAPAGRRAFWAVKLRFDLLVARILEAEHTGVLRPLPPHVPPAVQSSDGAAGARLLTLDRLVDVHERTAADFLGHMRREGTTNGNRASTWGPDVNWAAVYGVDQQDWVAVP